MPSLADVDDAQLVQESLAGRREAFDLIVARHQQSLYRLCYRYTGRHEDARDLTQDVFLRAYRGLSGFKGRSSLSTWLYRIGVNVCMSHVSIKRVTTEPLGDEPPADAGAADPITGIVAAEEARRVRAAIARLPARQRATLVLRVYHGLSHQEIAEVLGSSVPAAKTNLFHAMTTLRRVLGAP